MSFPTPLLLMNDLSAVRIARLCRLNMMVLHLKTIVQSIYVAFAAVVCGTANQILVPEVDINPSSILVPTGTMAVFECRVRHCPQTCSVYWVINGSPAAFEHQQNHPGFIFDHQHNTTSNIYTGRLTITASIRVNNTELYCLVQDGINPSRKTDHATLLVLSESPLIPNPSVKSQNWTTFLLEWSPPFLWPGEHIEYFVITVTKLIDGSVVTQAMNNSFTDAIVSMIVELDPFMHDLCTCNEFLFKIIAIGPGLVELLSYNVTGRYHSSCSLPEIALQLADINTTVLFTRKVNPILEININLPLLICAHQMVNYTISVTDKTVNQSNHSIKYIAYGPYLHLGPGTASHAITSGLEKDKEYSAVVNVWVESLEIQSHKVLFSTRFPLHDVFTHCTNEPLSDADVFHYKLSMGLCLTVVVFLLLLLIATLTLKQVYSKRMKCSN